MNDRREAPDHERIEAYRVTHHTEPGKATIHGIWTGNMLSGFYPKSCKYSVGFQTPMGFTCTLQTNVLESAEAALHDGLDVVRANGCEVTHIVSAGKNADARNIPYADAPWNKNRRS